MPYTDQLIPQIPEIEAEIADLTTRLKHLRRLLRLARDAQLLGAPGRDERPAPLETAK
jgi:hypothetical protein